MSKLIDKLIISIVDLRDRIKFPWNRWAKLMCVKFGVTFKDIDSVRFLGQCLLHISPDSDVRIGSGFVCRSGAEYAMDSLPYSKITTSPKAFLSIGDNVGMSNTVINCRQSITIGNNVKIGTGCLIMDSNFHSSDWRVRRSESDIKDAKSSPVTLCDDAFIGAGTIICKGVTIGERSMIAAGSVVVSDIPADCIAGGNPCKVIKGFEGMTN